MTNDVFTLQLVWEALGLRDCFHDVCWPKFYNHLEIKYRTTRFSINKINTGLTWHHDFVLEDQLDFTLTAPGMTFAIHLGKDENDIVYIEYEHDLSRRTVCKPKKAYVFPGGCIRHRTVREYNLRPTPVSQVRYSLVVFMNFKRTKAREMDVEMHEQFPYYNDNFKYRAKKYDFLSRHHGF